MTTRIPSPIADSHLKTLICDERPLASVWTVLRPSFGTVVNSQSSAGLELELFGLEVMT